MKNRLDECDYEERYQEAMSLIHEGEAMLDALEESMLKSRVGTGITIVEGGFYITRYGDRVGPMRRLTDDERYDYPEYEWTDCPVGVSAYQSVWTTEGFYLWDDWRPDDKDLVEPSDILTHLGLESYIGHRLGSAYATVTVFYANGETQSYRVTGVSSYKQHGNRVVCLKVDADFSDVFYFEYESFRFADNGDVLTFLPDTDTPQTRISFVAPYKAI